MVPSVCNDHVDQPGTSRLQRDERLDLDTARELRKDEALSPDSIGNVRAL